MSVHPSGKFLITENFFVHPMARNRPVFKTIAKYQFILFFSQMKCLIQRINIFHFHISGNSIPIHTLSLNYPLKNPQTTNRYNKKLQLHIHLSIFIFNTSYTI